MDGCTQKDPTPVEQGAAQRGVDNPLYTENGMKNQASAPAVDWQGNPVVDAGQQPAAPTQMTAPCMSQAPPAYADSANYPPAAPINYHVNMHQPVGQCQPNPHQVTHHVAEVPAPHLFAREECYAECVRFWWCRPIGWLAKGELAKARSFYLAGDYDRATEAARCANVWSTVGLIAGIILVAAIGVGCYLIVAYGIE